MALFKFIFILAIILYLVSALYFYRFWNSFKKLHIGDTLSKEFSIKSGKRIKIALILFVMGVVLNVIATFMKPF